MFRVVHLVVLDRVEFEDPEYGLVKPQVDNLAFAAACVAVVEGDHDRPGAQQTRDEVADGDAGGHRRPILFSDQVGEPAHCFRDPPEPAAVAVRTGLAEA